MGLNDSEELNIRMLVVHSYLIVTDGVKVVSVDPQNFSDFRSVTVNVGQHEAYDYEFAE